MENQMNGKRVHMYSNKQDREHHTHQETRRREESHTCENIIILFIFICFILFYFLFLFLFFTLIFVSYSDICMYRFFCFYILLCIEYAQVVFI